MEVEAFQRLDPESFYRKFIASAVRPDGRTLHAVRDISITPGVLSSHNVAASALVRLGDTKVVVGITLQIGVPSEAAPDCGDADISVLLTPLCSTKFSTGRPSEQAQALETLIRYLLSCF
jgi:exosome complex component RRP43